MSDRWASFDCYGTLIDWTAGLSSAFTHLWPGEDVEKLLHRYHEIEPRVELGSAKPYRRVLTEVLVLLSESEGLVLRPGSEGTLADSLPTWLPFPEVPRALSELRARGWKLAVLSNTDPDLLAASLDRIGVAVDRRITAAEAGSYKPAHGHWNCLLDDPGVDRGRYVHVAASLFHDVSPANELGVTVVWINREGESRSVPCAAELENVRRLPDVLDGLVPP